MKPGRYILIAAVAAATCLAWAQGASAQVRQQARPGMIDTAKQMRLKLRLLKEASGDSLAMAINRQEWDQLTPDERDKYRREALAFLSKSPEEQEKVLKHYEQLIKLSAQKREAYIHRAQWLQVVVASFTPQERDELTQLPPEQRARKLLDRKAELIRQGKLAPDTQPASAPAQ